MGVLAQIGVNIIGLYFSALSTRQRHRFFLVVYRGQDCWIFSSTRGINSTIQPPWCFTVGRMFYSLWTYKQTDALYSQRPLLWFHLPIEHYPERLWLIYKCLQTLVLPFWTFQCAFGMSLNHHSRLLQVGLKLFGCLVWCFFHSLCQPSLTAIIRFLLSATFWRHLDSFMTMKRFDNITNGLNRDF